MTHPGFSILQRILTTSPFQASLLVYLIDGIQGFDQNFDDNEPLFRSTSSAIIGVLRIIHRVLEVQDVFLDVLVPLLAEIPTAAH